MKSSRKARRERFDEEKYTEREYRNFGWARANDILSVSENENYRSKFADLKSGQVRFNRSKNGEYIIPVSDSSSPEVENTLVFAKGTIDNPVITSIIKILEYNETELDKVRRYIYDLGRRGFQPEIGGIIRRYNAFDFKNSWYGQTENRYEDNNGERYGRSGEENTGIAEGQEVSNTKSSRKRDDEERGKIYELEKENRKQKKLIEQLKSRMREMDKVVVRGTVDAKAVRAIVNACNNIR